MKLIEALNLLKAPPAKGATPYEVALVCGFTPGHLETFLAAHLRRLDPGRLPAVRTGLYGDGLGNLERLAGSPPAAIALVIEWADLDLRLGLRHLAGWSIKSHADILNTALARAVRFAEAIEQLAPTTPLALSLPTLPVPPIAYYPTWQAGPFDLGLRQIVANLAARVVGASGVRIINSQKLDELSPPRERLEIRTELSSGFPYRLPHTNALAELLAQLLRPPAPKKGLITDLDDTLWLGIVGDVGAEAIWWDLDHHAQIHGLYQQLLESLADAGVLLAVVSKNDPQVVDQAFQRSDLLLSRDRVFPLEVSWGVKSEAVGRILKAWNVGPDSVVFVDDSPMELAEVAAAHPEVLCLPFPKADERTAYELLVHLRNLFGKTTVTEEDAIRLESLRHTADAFGTAVSPSTSEALLEQAEADILLDFTRTSPDPRALELVNKTNQFNLNGRRYTDDEWQSSLKDPRSVLMVVSYRDKFGPLGKIAVLTGRVLDQGHQTLTVDQWVMSCRAFSRRIEHQCLAILFEVFKVQELIFDFQATPRNGPLRDFFENLLGTPPAPGLRLDRETFHVRCPALHHQVRGLQG
jgi:FkbH-like protein